MRTTNSINSNNEALINGQTSLLKNISSVKRKSPHNGDLHSTTINSSLAHNLSRPETPEHNYDSDELPSTPPSKKAKFFFKRCFDSTFNPDTVPGYNNILAEDSDEDR